MLEDLEGGILEYELVEKFLANNKKRTWKRKQRDSKDNRVEKAGARK